MTLITGKFVEFPRLLARTLKNCELSAGKSGARNSFFSVSD